MANTMPEPSSFDPLEQLELDPYNPRLRSDEEGKDQATLLETMIRRFKIEELADSIISAGYLPFDPLIGHAHDGKVRILEGNRRLAAVKLLLKPGLAPEKQQTKWQSLSDKLSLEQRESLRSLEVIVYPDRSNVDLTAYIGFRHVTGVLQWPALEKASFIDRMVNEGMSYAGIAERVGSYPLHVERHYVAYRLVRQAADYNISGRENMEDFFGVLLRALQADGVSAFLGVTYPHDPKQSQRPVPDDHIQNLTEFVQWTFGTDDYRRVLSDSRELTRWGKILQSGEALRYLRLTDRPDFERAWGKSGGQAESLVDAIWAAAYRLEESVPLIAVHHDNTDVQEAVRQCALFFMQILQQFPDLLEQYRIESKDA